MNSHRRHRALPVKIERTKSIIPEETGFSVFPSCRVVMAVTWRSVTLDTATKQKRKEIPFPEEMLISYLLSCAVIAGDAGDKDQKGLASC
jgi:hypothetical protein